MTRKRHPKRLPKAPVAEAVFELRWNLQGDAKSLAAFRYDPGLLPLLENFTKRMKTVGYVSVSEMARPTQTAPLGVTRRFFKHPNSPFPLMQIGLGIFACNESSEYEWKRFKAQIATGVRGVLAAYPKIAFAPLSPNYFELRYVDVFDSSLVGTAHLFEFAKKGLLINFGVPKVLTDPAIFAGPANGRFAYRRNLKDWKGSRLLLDIASAKKGKTNEAMVRMETKVICEDTGVPKLSSPAVFLRKLDRWLEFAHSVTSPLFADLVSPAVMRKFEGK